MRPDVRSMNAAVKDVMAKIREMGPRERKALIRGIIVAGLLSEDEEDALVSEWRKHEPAMPAEEFFAQLANKRARTS